MGMNECQDRTHYISNKTGRTGANLDVQLGHAADVSISGPVPFCEGVRVVPSPLLPFQTHATSLLPPPPCLLTQCLSVCMYLCMCVLCVWICVCVWICCVCCMCCSDLSRRLNEARVQYESWQYTLTHTNTASDATFSSKTSGWWTA